MRHAVDFRGKASEYFGIWTVNVLLTILTLGIYSAWAKVRTQRYFHGNTFIDGHSFEYHASPMQILIGRIIVVVALVIFSVINTVLPLLSIVLIILYGLIFPLLIVRGIRFQNRVTSYRNVRFDFVGGYLQALAAYILLPFCNFATLFLLTPLVSKVQAEYYAGNTRYGNRPFTLDLPVGPLYGVVIVNSLIVGGVVVLAIVGLSVTAISADALSSVSEDVGDTLDQVLQSSAGLLFVFIVYLTFLICFIRYGVVQRNLTYNNAVIDGRHRLLSTLSIIQVIWLRLSNFIAVAASLGLLIPWARIRASRYFADQTALVADGPLDTYVSTVKSEMDAIGAEFIDVEGLDLGIQV